MLALVLGGGNALGAFHGGVVEALDAAGVWPEWIAGSSIGAITGALLAGNKPERRLQVVREFWRRGAMEDGGSSWVPQPLRRGMHFVTALQARLTGQPSLFHLRLAYLLGGSGPPGLYDRFPMRRTLEGLIDFDLLNAGAIRLSVMTVDVETGAEVSFDTARERITLDHLMASSGLIPDFPPVEIGGRALVDGGLSNNVPADLVLAEAAREPLACIAVDLWPLLAPRPARLADAAERQSDLAFGCQLPRTLAAMRQLWEVREGPPGAVYTIRPPYDAAEVAMKSYDFARSSVERRWAKGREAMTAALRCRHEQPPSARGLALHTPKPGGVRAAS